MGVDPTGPHWSGTVRDVIDTDGTCHPLSLWPDTTLTSIVKDRDADSLASVHSNMHTVSDSGTGVSGNS